jgi:hypothetical protein
MVQSDKILHQQQDRVHSEHLYPVIQIKDKMKSEGKADDFACAKGSSDVQ